MFELILIRYNCNYETCKGEMPYMLNKKETALLVIDMQYGGGAPDGSLVKMLNVDVKNRPSSLQI